ncbi:carboxylesterase/lipase family protein [Kutzneria sp. NPDC052558]|uniref:carboxylesterase/lipase family protein n=1 Tax=Kutzneria sp. NPDC052558 TaxID=3364121 RepID=UPI0037C67BCD
MSTEPVVTTAHGDVRGLAAEGVLAFKGIPYAAPPVGPNRFQPPQPPQPWATPLDATEYGPTAPQAPLDPALAGVIPKVVRPGDDYLNLNVWTPDLAGDRPVMVYIHGGSFTSGSGSIPGYNGARFARDGVVLVTINYRLGADGFLWFGEGTPNLGLLDQIAALTWVRDNVAGFGGDPGNVTVFGESAGAMSVCALLAMPAAEGLFHRAIAESGSAHISLSPDNAALIGKRLAHKLGVEPTREAVAAVPTDLLIAAQTELDHEMVTKPLKSLWGEAALNVVPLPFEPVVDGELLPAAPITRIAEGASAGVQVMIGTTAEEARLFLVPTGAISKINNLILDGAAVRYRLPMPHALRQYRADRHGATAGDLFSALVTDYLFWIPALRLAEAHPGAHVYEFAWRSPAYDNTLGACHIAELPYVFDNLDEPGFATLLGDNPPQKLADAMHRAWIDFATTGDPGWPAYSPEHRVAMRFDVDSATTVDERAAERVLWDGLR